MKTHTYKAACHWLNSGGAGTRSYDGYSRSHVLRFDGKAELPGSADPAFRGDPKLHNPEELLLGSISACHMLWYLHLCAVNGVVVVSYEDHAEAVMVEDDKGGHFEMANLRPHVAIETGCCEETAQRLHSDAHDKCFIANSVNFPIRVTSSVSVIKA